MICFWRTKLFNCLRSLNLRTSSSSSVHLETTNSRFSSSDKHSAGKLKHWWNESRPSNENLTNFLFRIKPKTAALLKPKQFLILMNFNLQFFYFFKNVPLIPKQDVKWRDFNSAEEAMISISPSVNLASQMSNISILSKISIFFTIVK